MTKNQQHEFQENNVPKNEHLSSTSIEKIS